MRKTIVAIGLVLGALAAADGAVAQQTQQTSGTNTRTLRLTFGGDLMGHKPQINAARTAAGGYDYTPFFQYLAPYVRQADIAQINLEYTLAGEPYAGYPEFSSPDESVFAIKDAGFNLITTANNHSVDRGKQGLERTLDVLDSMNFTRLGTYRDSAEWRDRHPLLIEQNGIKLAFMTYTYGTNELPVTPPNVVNLIDTVQIAADIERARRANPDFIIAIMHWGPEYEIAESEQQRQWADFLARSGVDLIIGGHPHVVQPFRMLGVPGREPVPVIFSLGNFFSNQRNRYRDGGIMFDVTLEKSAAGTRITSMSYLPFWVYRFVRGGRTDYRLLPACTTAPACENYNMSREDRAAMNLFFRDTRGILNNLREITEF